MSKAILRIKKLKTHGNIGSMSSHVARTRPTPNADPDKKNQNFILAGTGDQLVDYKNRIAELKIENIRKNAVLAVDHMLTASPEFFRNYDSENQEWDREKLKRWASENVRWLNEKYGKNCISATLHLDERTPHIHALILPVHEGKLNARHFYGGREKLSELQSDYARAMEPLGLERGQKGSKAKHQTIKKHYEEVNKNAFKQGQKAHEKEADINDRMGQIKKLREEISPTQRPKK